MTSFHQIIKFIFVGIFIVAISLPLILMPFGEGKEISGREQRRLATKPEFPKTLSSLEEYPEKFQKYFNDHFGQRNDILSWANRFKEKVFQKSKARHAVLGDADWLYYNIDGSILDFIGYFEPNVDQLENWKQGLNLKTQWLEKRDVFYLLVAIPNKVTVYPEYLPSRYSNNQGVSRLMAFNTYLEKDSGRSFIDAGVWLNNEKGNNQVYFKHDTHWNDFGAYATYYGTLNYLSTFFPSLVPYPLEAYRQEQFEKIGDIARLGLESDQYGESSHSLMLKNPCETLSEQPVERFIDTPAYQLKKKKLPLLSGCPTKNLKALVVHDSFGHFLKKFLNQHFKEIIYMPSYDIIGMESFIREYDPDIYIDFRSERRFHLLLEFDEQTKAALRN